MSRVREARAEIQRITCGIREFMLSWQIQHFIWRQTLTRPVLSLETIVPRLWRTFHLETVCFVGERMVRIHRCESDVMRNVVTFSVVIDSDLSKDTLREGHTNCQKIMSKITDRREVTTCKARFVNICHHNFHSSKDKCSLLYMYMHFTFDPKCPRINKIFFLYTSTRLNLLTLIKINRYLSQIGKE